MKRIILFICLLSIISMTGYCLTPTMFVLKDPDNNTSMKEPLSITKVNTEVLIHGYLAETSVTLTFLNNSDRDLEGEFFFPLPKNSVVTGYALDIKDEMVDGVAVEKMRAQSVFEAIKRRMIDPGLVEWQNSQCFKTRVYPIFKNKTRTIRVKYLTKIQNGQFCVPLKYQKKIPEFNLMLKVFSLSNKSGVTTEGLSGVEFTEDDRNLIAKLALKDAKPDQDILINLPVQKKDSILYEKAADDKIYFCAQTVPEIKEAPGYIIPEKITIVWDASGSRLRSDHDSVYQVLADYFERYKNRDIDVDVKVVRHNVAQTVAFNVKKGDWGELLKFLKNIYYDGATQLGVIKPDKKAPSFYLFVTDGYSTFNKQALPEFNAPVFSLSAKEAGVQKEYLTKLGAETGGAYIDSLQGNTGRIGIPSFNFISVNDDLGAVIEVTPNSPAIVDGNFVLTGLLQRSDGTIKLNFGFGKQIQLTKEFKITETNVVEASLINKYKALLELQQLMVLPERNKAKITKLGKKYGLVTPFTSLMVLESLSQYVQYRIPPPETKPEMRKQYFTRLNTQKAKKEYYLNRFVMNQIAHNWQDRVTWWNAIFKYEPGFKYKPFSCIKNDDTWYDDDSFEEGASFDQDDTFGVTLRPALITRIAAAGDDGGGRGDRDNQKNVSNTISISLKNSEPVASYIEEMEILDKDKQFSKYLEFRKEYYNSPSFYFNCADFFAKNKDRDKALQILLNFLELEMDNIMLMRALANKLTGLGETELAIEVLEKAREIDKMNPNILRDLGLLLGKRGDLRKDAALKKADYQKALELLFTIVKSRPEKAFANIVLMEINNIIPKARATGVTDFEVPLSLRKSLYTDLRIVTNTFGAKTPLSLTIIEPSEEKASVKHPLTLTGGFMSGNLGVQEYFVRKAMKGQYQVVVDAKLIRPHKIFGAVFVNVDIYTNYGRKNEKVKSTYIALKKGKDQKLIGSIDFKGDEK